MVAICCSEPPTCNHKARLIRSALAQAWAAMGYDARAERRGAAGPGREHQTWVRRIGLAVEARYLESARRWSEAAEHLP